MFQICTDTLPALVHGAELWAVWGSLGAGRVRVREYTGGDGSQQQTCTPDPIPHFPIYPPIPLFERMCIKGAL